MVRFFIALLAAAASASALQVSSLARAPVHAAMRTTSLRMQAPEATEAAAASAATIEVAGVVVPSGTSATIQKALETNDSLRKVVKRAEFWTNESATLLEIINVVGRWETYSDFVERTEFTEAEYRDENLSQAGTERRYKMALKLKCTERFGLIQNAPKLPFKNERLAASVGLTVEDFAGLPVTPAACNVVYDALAESRSGLIPYEVCDQRRKEWINDDGSLNDARFLIGLAKSRFLVIIAWFVFGKGNFVWVLLFAQALHDIRPDLFPTPKELGLDKIGFFT